MSKKILLISFLLVRISVSQETTTHHSHTTHGLQSDRDTIQLKWTTDDTTKTIRRTNHGITDTATAHSDQWMTMVHGNIFASYTNQGGKRGSDQVSIPNWFMASARKEILGNHSITFRGMLSLDRLLIGGNGYPLLLQSGETWKGEPLVDRQHPHDLFAEVSSTFQYSFNEQTDAVIYLAFPGEPAIGPPAFMHRPAAQFNPDAPIGHHWQDATHISYGVASAGFITGPMKLEGSIFNGREPDENRYNFDTPRFDSYSGRLSYNLGEEFSLQLSYGFLRNPEGHGDDVKRVSASVLYSTVFDESESLHASALFGQNSEHHVTLHSYLLELAYIIGDVGLYGRHESIEKLRFDLGITVDNQRAEKVHQITVGVNTRMASYGNHSLRAGVQGMLSVVSDLLEPFYGKNPTSYQIYLQLQ